MRKVAREIGGALAAKQSERASLLGTGMPVSAMYSGEKHNSCYYLLGAFATRRRNRNLHALQLHTHVRIPAHACVKPVVDIHVL